MGGETGATQYTTVEVVVFWGQCHSQAPDIAMLRGIVASGRPVLPAVSPELLSKDWASNIGVHTHANTENSNGVPIRSGM
jgi:hypothetical protein